MLWAVLTHLAGFVIDLVADARGAEDAKDLEIALLRHQVRLLQRRSPRLAREARWEKLIFAALATKLYRLAAGPRARLSGAVLLVQPGTVLRWHRDLVRRKGTYRRGAAGGRPRLAAEVEALLLRLTRENPRWGYGRLLGELAKLGHPLGRSTIWDTLKRRRAPPAPRRGRRAGAWRRFLAQHRDAVLACDFFTVETLCRKTLYAPFFVELGTRRVHLADCTAHPTAARGTQQALRVRWILQDGASPMRHLICDRDAKFLASFDTGFAAEGIAVIRAPYRAPNAYAHAERWIRSAREECLDHPLIVNQAHLRSVLAQYTACYNDRRPHQGRDQAPPVPLAA